MHCATNNVAIKKLTGKPSCFASQVYIKSEAVNVAKKLMRFELFINNMNDLT